MEHFNSPIQSYEGWNLNQSYLTPSYMANFRPAYSESGMRENPFARRDTLWESAYRYGPGEYSYGADSLSESSAHLYNLTSGFGDAAMTGLQAVAIPAAAWYGMHKFSQLGKIGGGMSLGARFGGAAAGGGMRAATGVMGGLARGVGLGGLAARGAGAAGMAATGVAGIGAAAGSMFAPIMAATAAASAANSLLINPYISTRRGMDAMRANTANQFISGAGQAESGGFGMSATRAQEISQALTVSGQQDYSLSGGMYNEIADNMMRAGIFQEVGDMDTTRIVEGVKKATSVLKLISRVTGDPDIRNGISTLATLKSGGLDDIGKMNDAMNSLRISSAGSGVSVQQLMDTIGNQGQVMAQQQGMRGITGLLASADVFAGFTNARKAGLISGGQMQALGGAEGMTQNVMTAAYQTMNSGYGRMVMQGRGNFGGGLTDTLGRWGNSFSNDPIKSQGDWFMNQGAYKDAYMNVNGPSSIVLNSLIAKAKAMGQDHTDGRVLAAMAESEGMSPEQFRSIAEADRARQDPLSRMRMSDARRTSNRSDYASSLQQEGLGLKGVPVLGSMQEMFKQSMSYIKGQGALFMEPVTGAIADISDSIESTLSSTKGIVDDKSMSNVIKYDNGIMEIGLQGYERGINKIRGGPMAGTNEILRKSDKHDAIIERINRLSAIDDPKVRKLVTRALKYAKAGDYDSAMLDFDEIDRITKGGLSGSTVDYEQIIYSDKLESLLRNREIQIEERSGIIKPTERTAEVDVNVAMLSDDPKAAIDALVKSRGVDDLELIKAVGLKPEDLSGMGSAYKKEALAKAAVKHFNRARPDIEGSAGERKKEFLRRVGLKGVNKEDALSYYKNQGQDLNTLLEGTGKFNPLYGNTSGDAVNDEVRKINKFVQDQEKRDKDATESKWNHLIDVKDGIGKLGPVFESNTEATRLLTEAITTNTNAIKPVSFQDKVDALQNKLFGNTGTESTVR